jgi:hypothetical protein
MFGVHIFKADSAFSIHMTVKLKFRFKFKLNLPVLED